MVLHQSKLLGQRKAPSDMGLTETCEKCGIYGDGREITTPCVPLNQTKEHWVIAVSSWGTLYAIGTEQEAEEWRCHKARWEGSVAIKRLATEKEIDSEDFINLSELL